MSTLFAGKTSNCAEYPSGISSVKLYMAFVNEGLRLMFPKEYPIVGIHTLTVDELSECKPPLNFEPCNKKSFKFVIIIISEINFTLQHAVNEFIQWNIFN